MIILKRPWRSQPQTLVPLGPQFAGGLAFAFEASFGGLDVVTEAIAPAVGVQRVGTQYGQSYYFNGSQGNTASTWGLHQGLAGATAASWDILIRLDGSSGKLFSQWDDANQNWLFQQSTTDLIWVPLDDDSSNRRRWDLAGAFPAAGWYRIQAAWTGSTALMVINGADKSSSLTSVNAAGTTHSSGVGLDELRIGCAGGAPITGAVVFARMWRRFVTAQEFAAMAANPWQLYQPLPRRIWAPASTGATNTDISAGVGALSVAGYAPRADKSVLLSGASASDITATGATPRVTITY